MQTRDPSSPVLKYEAELASLRKDLERVSHQSQKQFGGYQSQLSCEEDDNLEV